MLLRWDCRHRTVVGRQVARDDAGGAAVGSRLPTEGLRGALGEQVGGVALCGGAGQGQARSFRAVAPAAAAVPLPPVRTHTTVPALSPPSRQAWVITARRG